MQTERLYKQELQNSAEDGREWNDAELVEKARSGNGEAFGELVRRHRERALGWASRFAQDSHLAEDIVQDAFIRAFLHLGMLIDASRFKPWLRRIIRNQVNMRLRRGGIYGKERPFSGFEKAPSSLEGLPEQGGTELDRLLYRMSAQWDNESRRRDGDPQLRIMRREMLEEICLLLKCLTPKERNVFEAFFFRQLSPADIASEFGASIGSVYTTLSRSRVKVQRERIRVYFQDFAERKKLERRPTRKVLAPPISF